MRLPAPKDDEKYQWTNHVMGKMLYYGLSEGRIRRVVHSPRRVEEGIAPGTIAVMQPAGTLRKPHEIWVMYQLVKPKLQNSKSKRGRKRIITAWRYLGKSKPRSPVPIPEEIKDELGL